MRLVLAFAFAMVSLQALAQLASGPMLGYCEMKEALVWIQTSESQTVSLVYNTSGQEPITLPEITTQAQTGFTHKFVLTPLEPGTTYEYQIILDGQTLPEKHQLTTQKLWKHRVDPPNFSFVAGSCAYINEPKYDRPGPGYGQSLDIFNKIDSVKPDMMLWLGDNIYLREPDWTSFTGFLHRYTHMRSQPELQNLLSRCPHFAIWDDHDYGPNDACRSYVHKDWSYEAFKLFWGNPSFGLPDHDGITTQFQFNDAEFFLLDNRYHRTEINVENQEQWVYGPEQVEWLIEALKFSKAPFKFVATGGQFVSNFAKYENHARFEKERKYIIKRIKEEGITGVIFLSGDRHSTELSMMELKKGNKIYDLTCSPLTSKAYDHSEEPNKHRLEGTHVGTQNFAQISITGKMKQRVCTINIYDAKGQLQWSQEIQEW